MVCTCMWIEDSDRIQMYKYLGTKVAMTEVLSDMLVHIYHHYNRVAHVLFINNSMWK